MNGTIVFGVALIAVALFMGGMWLLPMLVAGVAVAAFGAFSPSASKKNNAPQRMAAEDDPFV